MIRDDVVKFQWTWMETIGVVANKHDKLAENRLKITKSRPFFSVKSENLKNAGNGLKCIEK